MFSPLQGLRTFEDPPEADDLLYDRPGPNLAASCALCPSPFALQKCQCSAGFK